jgi:hypothetical protein
MRVDWLPYSAASLVLGATALSVGALLAPQLGEENVLLSDFADKRWLAVAVLYFIASAALTVGMPSVMTLFERRGGRLGLCAIGIFTIGTLGIAGYAFLIAFMRALAKEGELGSLDLEFASQDTGLLALLYGWILAFYVGELLLGIALLRANTTPKWIPGALLMHVALFPLSLLLPSLLPQQIQSLTALLVTVGLCGVGITANQQASRVAVPV